MIFDRFKKKKSLLKGEQDPLPFVEQEEMGKQDTKEIQVKKFKRMMYLAESIFSKAEEHVVTNGYYHPIFNYIKLLGMPLQTSYLTNLLYDDDNGENKIFPDITPWLVFFDLFKELSLGDKTTYYDLVENQEMSITVDLVKDLVLPWPWNFSRLVNSISSIGPSRPFGKWKQDENHRLLVWLPLGICFVEGGNHSITSGILNGEGTIQTNDVYDMSKLYSFVYTDGLHYRRIADDSIIAEVQNTEFAVMFEVGRMMIERGISRA